MNRGLLLKSAIETWPVTVLCGALLASVEAVLAYVLPTFEEQFSQSLMQIRFVQTFVSAMLGANVSESIGPEAFVAFAWVHPVVLALVWSHALMCCTRMPAGEIDRGTIDLTLTLPVSRWTTLISETAIWIVAAFVLLAFGLLGNLAGGAYVEHVHETDFARTLLVLANLGCLYLAVGGLAWLASAASSRRGPAMTVVFLLLLASFLLNFLAQFWKVAEHVSPLGLMYYYRPLYILRDGTVPWSDLSVLIGVAAVTWIAAGIVLSRRDICTV
jgi:ABC-2 type transport system permease protein